MERSNNLLQVSHELRTDAAVVTARGELDMLTTPQLTEELTAVCRAIQAPKPVIVDLREITFLGSAAIGSLMNAHQECADAGTPLRIVAADRVVLRPLNVLGLSSTFTIADRIEAALDMSIVDAEPAESAEQAPIQPPD